MLHKKRSITGCYLILWLIAFTLSHENLESIIWVTQLVFSGEIIVQWINLEVLRSRQERTFDELHTHFLHNTGAGNPKAIATVLDCFASYETAKSSAGILLSSKVFNKINPELTKRWEQIRQDLKMDQQDSIPSGG